MIVFFFPFSMDTGKGIIYLVCRWLNILLIFTIILRTFIILQIFISTVIVTKMPDQLQTLSKIFCFDFMSRREKFLNDIFMWRRTCCAC